MWIGTSDMGLNKFDSYQISLYQYHENQPGSISNNSVTCIFEDREKNLWVGTQNGLNLFKTATESFTVFKNDTTNKNSLGSSFITSIIEDKTGNIWIACDRKGGLNKWVPEKKGFIHYKIPNSEDDSPFNSMTSISEDSNGDLWIGSRGRGIYCFHPESEKFIIYDDPAIDFGNNLPQNVFVDNQGLIWIASRGGLYSFDPSTSKFEHFGTKADGKGTSNNLVRQVIQKDENHLLIAVNQSGLNIFDKKSRTFEYIGYDEENEEGLNSPSVYVIYIDYENILWVGTPDGGVNYYNPQKEKFKRFIHKANNPNSIPYNIVVCFYEDSEGFIWIGTAGEGVSLFDPKTESFTNYQFDPSNPYSISGNAIRCITEDKEKNIWIGTWNSGLNRFNRKTGKFYHFLPDKNNLSSISSKSFWQIRTDHNDNIWLGGTETGIDVFNKENGVIKRFRADPDNPNSLSNNTVRFIYEDPERNVWICTNNGINLYDSINNTFKVYANFPDNDIRAFCKDKSGNLWAGTFQHGMVLFKTDGSLVKIYNTTNGLPNNTIHAIVEDNNNNLWISTNNGISKFNYKTQRFRNYNLIDGLQGNQFYPESFLKAHDGEIYFGGYYGFNSFYPDSLKDNELIPPVYITDFQIFNKKVPVGVQGSPLKNHISEAKEITLSWRQSVFSFGFTAINYTHPEKNQYAYMMEGFEKDWNYADAARRYVTYTNLDPGEYTFKVKASNNDGVWNETGTSIRIIVLPPWWNTWWFRLIIFCAIIFLIVSIYLSRVRHFKNQKILLEKLVAMKTSELNELNASKDKFFSIIAHDLKGPFGAIIGFSDILKEEIESGDPAENKEHARLINISAVQTFRLLENLLEWANSQTGKILFNPVSINLMELFNEEFSMLSDMAAGKNIEIKNFFPDNLTIIADKNMIKTVLRNLISNAIKFTHKNGKVEVKAMIANKHVEISVSDSGIGMTKETIAKLWRIDTNLSTRGTENEEGTGLGLFLCKEFVKKHDGKIWVESEPGKGSTFKFILPLDISHSV
jgi:Signal transduction histidine kinase